MKKLLIIGNCSIRKLMTYYIVATETVKKP